MLAAGRPALLVPRVRPRREQLVRAERLAARGLVDVLTPEQCTPEAVGAWLERTVRRGRLHTPGRVDLDGLARVPHMARDLVAAQAPVRAHEREAVGVA